jgi:hypothetical protein
MAYTNLQCIFEKLYFQETKMDVLVEQLNEYARNGIPKVSTEDLDESSKQSGIHITSSFSIRLISLNVRS